MKAPRLFFPIWVSLVVLWFAGAVRAETRHVYFGTSGGGTKGIYRATFDTETGKLMPAQLADQIGSPGFLTLHPDGTKLYAVANFTGGPGAAGYRISKDGALERINTSPTGAGGAAHIALLAAGADSNTVSVHRVNPQTGELTYQTKGVIDVPAPICILFAP